MVQGGNMPEFLRDPFWQFASAVLALVAIAISAVLYLLQRRRKALSYEVVSCTPLLSVREEVKGRVQIVFDDTSVSDAHMVVIRVLNSGNVPIIPSDYVRPVKFDFGEIAQILSAEVMETSPDNIEACIDPETLELMPVLLNSSDSIMLKILLARFDGTINMDGRIVGVKQIRTATKRSLPIAAMLIGITVTMAGLLLALSISRLPSSANVWELAVEVVQSAFLIYIGLDHSRRLGSLEDKRGR
jgi:hypothetical protein